MMADATAGVRRRGRADIDAVLHRCQRPTAYGQTGAGKTHTLLNAGDRAGTAADGAGAAARGGGGSRAHRVGRRARVRGVKASFAKERYNEQIDDLLVAHQPQGSRTPTGYDVDGSPRQCKTAAQPLLQPFDSAEPPAAPVRP